MTTYHVVPGDTIIVDPAPVVTPPPPPPAIKPSGPLVISTSGQVIDSLSFTGSSGYGIHATGTSSKPIQGLTIRNCTFSGAFFGSIWAEFVNLIDIEGCTIDGASYSGVMLISCVGGKVVTNTIRKIGPQVMNDSSTNAYGIALTDTGGPATSGVLVDGNLIEDIPTWQGVNTHNGQNLTISNNRTNRVRRAYWLAPVSGKRVTGCKVTGNTAGPLAAGTLDPTAFFVSDSDGCSFTGNHIDPSYPVGSGAEWVNYVRDYGNASTNLVRSGNTRP